MWCPWFGVLAPYCGCIIFCFIIINIDRVKMRVKMIAMSVTSVNDEWWKGPLTLIIKKPLHLIFSSNLNVAWYQMSLKSTHSPTNMLCNYKYWIRIAAIDCLCNLDANGARQWCCCACIEEICWRRAMDSS